MTEVRLGALKDGQRVALRFTNGHSEEGVVLMTDARLVQLRRDDGREPCYAKGSVASVELLGNTKRRARAS